MIKRWELRPDPSERDPDRHRLFVRAAASDLQVLVRRISVSCGRPRRESGDKDFNYSLSLPGGKPEVLEKIRAVLKALCPGGAATSPAPALAPDIRVIEPVRREEPLPASAPSVPASVQPPASAESAGQWGPAVPAAALAPAVQPVGAACVAPRLDMNFENLMVGSFNRFSHAVAASVASSPGELYNPLFLAGPAGSGKTHLIHAVANQTAAQRAGAVVWRTSGPRLSAAAAQAARSQKTAELEALAKDSCALFIDDVHLLEVREESTAILSTVLHAFLDKRRQVMMTSAYPARLLGGLEQALKFRLAAGWSGDLKTPTAEVQAETLTRLFKAAGWAVDSSDVEELRGRVKGSWNEALCAVRRVGRLRALLEAVHRPAGLRDLIPAVASVDAVEGVPDEAQLREVPSDAGAGPKPVAFLYPTGKESAAAWLFWRLHEAAKTNGWPFPFRPGSFIAVDPAQVFGAPFSAAARLDGTGAAAALMIGPPPGTDLAGREEEFRGAFSHIVSEKGLPVAWVSYSRMADTGVHLRAYLDLMEAAA
ncbi:MAG: DnaA/Hda family protein [Elusimicrobiota bacterium]|jgi:hypothetical protein